jgi:hypothetical protein
MFQKKDAEDFRDVGESRGAEEQRSRGAGETRE